MKSKISFMHKALNTLFIFSLLFFASCSDNANKEDRSLADKKAKLEELKKQQLKIQNEITSLQTEIVKIDPSAREEKAKLVSVKPVDAENFTHYIDLQGSVESEAISYVAPRNGQGGLVRAVYVKKGDLVNKGKLLLKLDDAIIKQQIDQAQIQLNYAKDLYQRRQNLWKENIGTEVELISAKNNVDQAQKQMDILKEQLGFTNVYADVSGVAEEVNIRVGEFFTGYTGTTPQIKIVNNDRLKVTVNVPENYLNQVKTGNQIQVNLPDVGKSINTTISLVGKTIDENTRSFYVEAKLPHDKDLRANQVATVKIQDYSAKDAITVPVNTLQTDENGKYVLVADDENGKKIAVKKPVKAGQLYGDKIEITEGLKKGDKIITEGFQGLFAGQLITTSNG